MNRPLRHNFSGAVIQALLTHGAVTREGCCTCTSKPWRVDWRCQCARCRSKNALCEIDKPSWRERKEWFCERCGFSEEVLVLLCWRNNKVTWINLFALWDFSWKPLLSYILHIGIYLQCDRYSFVNLHYCVDWVSPSVVIVQIAQI